MLPFYNKRNVRYLGLATLAVGAVFGPDLSFSSVSSSPRALSVAGEEQSRALQATKPAPPPGFDLQCGPGQEAFTLDWTDVTLDFSKDTNVVTFSTGTTVTIKTSTTGGALLNLWTMWSGNNIRAPVFGTKQKGGFCGLDPSFVPTYPDAYVTMDLTFDSELLGLYISIGDVDSTAVNSDAVRIRMADGANNPVPLDFAATGTIRVVDNFAFEPSPSKSVANPGFTAALYAKANGLVKSIQLDQSAFIYDNANADNLQVRSVFPGVDFTYCATTPEPTPSPTIMALPAPLPAPTAAPIPAPTAAPVPDPTPAPQTEAPVTAGVNGDPLIMGLKGQLFFFNGRSGAWYSAISTPSFQWNMRISEYETCPSHSNTFVSGASFTFHDKKNKKSHNIEINVVNEYNVDVGCGSGPASCLGAGSLEMMIDGKKQLYGGNYAFGKNGAGGEILAFNTFYQCSRKWHDFEVVSAEKQSLRHSRALSTDPNVFETIDGLKDTMIDKEVCQQWIEERKLNGDLFDQAGHYSTIIVKTDAVTFHIEYKQENERCNAHSLDVWVSKASPEITMQNWEGVIGETKEPTDANKDKFDRKQVLKYAEDSDYEVMASHSNKCKGCAN